MCYLQILQSDIRLAHAHTFHHYTRGKPDAILQPGTAETPLAVNAPQVFLQTCCFLTPMCCAFMLSAPIFMSLLRKHTYSEMLLWMYSWKRQLSMKPVLYWSIHI